jgi:RNA polymerase sigma-70 factor (ECF subfamily)
MELLELFCEGDRLACEAVYNNYRGRLYRFLLRQTANKKSADILFKETWIRAVQQRSALKPDSHFPYSLFSIAHKRLQRHYQKLALVKSGADLEQDTEIPDLPYSDPVEDMLTSPKNRLNSLLKLLPPPLREIFLLREEGRLSSKAIGSILHIKGPRAKHHLLKALDFLDQGMEGDTSPDQLNLEKRVTEVYCKTRGIRPTAKLDEEVISLCHKVLATEQKKTSIIIKKATIAASPESGLESEIIAMMRRVYPLTGVPPLRYGAILLACLLCWSLFSGADENIAGQRITHAEESPAIEQVQVSKEIQAMEQRILSAAQQDDKGLQSKEWIQFTRERRAVGETAQADHALGVLAQTYAPQDI